MRSQLRERKVGLGVGFEGEEGNLLCLGSELGWVESGGLVGWVHADVGGGGRPIFPRGLEGADSRGARPEVGDTGAPRSAFSSRKLSCQWRLATNVGCLSPRASIEAINEGLGLV